MIRFFKKFLTFDKTVLGFCEVMGLLFLIISVLFTGMQVRLSYEQSRQATHTETLDRTLQLLYVGQNRDIMQNLQILQKISEGIGGLENYALANQYYLSKIDSKDMYGPLDGHVLSIVNYLQIVSICFDSGACSDSLRSFAFDSYHHAAMLVCPVVQGMSSHGEAARVDIKTGAYRPFFNFFPSCKDPLDISQI